ncbi:MAG: hypothetical protein WC637_00390 [Victivallales bacterium]|jgi:hypothetical protein
MPKIISEMDKKFFPIKLSFNEIVALRIMLVGGRMFTKDEYKKCVNGVMARIGKAIEAQGVPRATVEQLIKL